MGETRRGDSIDERDRKLMALVDGGMNQYEVAERLDLTPGRVSQIVSRVTAYRLAEREAEEAGSRQLEVLTGPELLAALDDRIKLAFAALGKTKFKITSAKDLVSAIKQMVDMRQVLQGQPTQIIDHRMRADLDDLLPRLLEEARRRGIEAPVIDVTPDEERG